MKMLLWTLASLALLSGAAKLYHDRAAAATVSVRHRARPKTKRPQRKR